MPTKQELQAEIDRLRTELEQTRGQQKDDLVTGEYYQLNIGQAQITGFYEEFGHQKVRFILRPVDPEDGHTILDGHKEVLMSTPIDNFRRWQAQFLKDQQQREILAARRQRRLKTSQGKRV